MSFLFRKYARDDRTGDISLQDDVAVESTDQPLREAPEFKLWPPSPKAQILYIGIGLFLFNLLLIAIWAVALYYNS